MDLYYSELSSDNSINSSINASYSSYRTPMNSPDKFLNANDDVQEIDDCVVEDDDTIRNEDFSSFCSSFSHRLDQTYHSGLSKDFQFINKQKSLNGSINSEFLSQPQSASDLKDSFFPEHNDKGLVDRDLISRLKLIMQSIKLIESECSKVKLYEDQLRESFKKIQNFRENLFKENNSMLKLLSEIIYLVQDRSLISSSSEIISLVNGGSLSKCLDSNRIVSSDQDSILKSLIEFSRSNQPIHQIEDFPEMTKEIKEKLHRLPALVRGYLVRKLMRTNKVSNLKRTIKDTSTILVNFKKNLTNDDGCLKLTLQDVLFHRRLCVQLEKACQDFYAIFFDFPISKQMQMIANHRQSKRNQMSMPFH
ncbi:Centriolar coiled-coil protein [Sarcoptes scabiei]|uniref:Centriolar coiled-coil protein n=1 Tax=Sarcoptes scabiei TaxID=52283 RepID=A0A834VCY7_SARSC|nr:Centriolar coiled-coil protein [Sarcoptes scabiei]